MTHIAKTLDEVAKDNGLDSIATVTVEIGEVSGILLDYFTDCWDYFKVKNPVLKDCKMIIETIPALTYCEDCRQTYETVKYAKICPHCGSEHTYLVQGNECNIKQIEVED